MKQLCLEEFQEKVDNVLLRHRSALDILTKMQESNAKINRAVAKSSTYCGCTEIAGKKQEIPADVTFSESKDYISDHMSGSLCEMCREKVEQEIANHFFYLAALCNLLNTDLDSLLKDYYNNQLKTLGKYGLL
ncbi:DUF1573 domain-containing protein [Serpentinicella sp. ANB-PHB4]|uniref:DUF1573 domain-containing protein n=1 Tax=Serpentinicella sp. ANB-PHB4 TaxID=3074076 RepID=UPI002856E619|nr:DUF1573 domain-containing protein [Serpentinicella sp. ANB-PHB4]MDR5659913.1 DUF1573 domain-containing protein [Serpentinicella sp. ANB-PHB4]